MKTKEVAKSLAKVARFKKRGSFYIGTCNDRVIAGYCLDAPPSAVYVWKFVLPSFDDIEFLHLSLGKRIYTLPRNDDVDGPNLTEVIQRDWLEFSTVNDCKSLIEYINAEKLEGTYALWVRYLTHIRCKEFDAAERFYSNTGVTSELSKLRAISKQFAELSEARNRSGWDACSMLLDEWQRKTRAAYC